MNIKRKDFVSTTALALGAIYVNPFIAYSNSPKLKAAKGFSLKIMAPYWGFNGSMYEFFKKAKNDGYDGVEIIWLNDASLCSQLFAAFKEFELEVGFLCRGDESDPQKQLHTYKNVLHKALTNPHQKPLYINVHSGRDFFSETENQKFIDHSLELEKRFDIPIYHETHRSRMLYAAHISKSFLEANKNLRITLDISHWCNVSESLLEDQQDAVMLALERTEHVHSRIGHPEGPQIGDPRAPEWKQAVDAHFAWWDKIVAMKKQEGKPLTMLTEFGPPTYMPTIPFTNKPVADQWTINKYMMDIWKKRYL